MSRDAVKWAVRRGAWRQVYPGVYATHAGQLTRPAQLWATVLYAGKGAILSHQTAAEMNGLTDRRDPRIHVTVPDPRRVVAPPGVVVHVSRRVIPNWRFAAGIPPYTLTEDTVVDLVCDAATLEEAIGWITAAFGRRLTGERLLRQTLAARSRVRWRAQVDEAITFAAGGAHSVLEFRYDRDVERAHGLPPAARQVPFTKTDGGRGFRDRCYREWGQLVIELDGRRYHQGDSRQRDRARDNQAAASGGTTLRYDWADVTRGPCRTAAQVHQALRGRGYPGAIRACSPGCRATGQPLPAESGSA